MRLTDFGPVVTVLFKNWSHDRVRYARLDVYFDKPEGWEPIPQATEDW